MKEIIIAEAIIIFIVLLIGILRRRYNIRKEKKLQNTFWKYGPAAAYKLMQQ